MLGHRFRRSTLWLTFFTSILAGIGLSYRGIVLGPIILWVPLMVTIKRSSWLSLIVLIAVGFALGGWRGSTYLQKTSEYNDYMNQKVAIYVRAGEDGTYNKYKQLTFKAGHVRTMDGNKLTGDVQISGFGANAIFEGDEVLVEGQLRSGFGRYQGSLSYVKLTVISHNPSPLTLVKRKFIAGMQSALPEPLASFGMGLLVGQRANLPETVKEDLLKVGLTHIIAVSGANLTIILHACQRLMGKRSKRVYTFVSVSFLLTFVLITGGSASIVRAAMVSMLSIATLYYGRNFKPLNLIFLAAVITAWADPVYIWSDLSWHLSFLAFIGVMLLAPLVQQRWLGRWKNSIIVGVAVESICAEILTLPLVLFVFGQMSRVGLLANVLVVAFIPIAMLLGTIAGLAGLLLPTLSGWFAWPATLLLNYMLDVSHLLANLPGIFVEGIGLALWQMAFLYCTVIFFMAVLWYKSEKSSIITDMEQPKTRSLIA